MPPFWRDDIAPFLLAQKHIDHRGWREHARPNTRLDIELMHAPRAQIDSNMVSGPKFTTFRKPIGEPVVPFNIISHDLAAPRYTSTCWDFVFLSHSPGYVPPSADALLPVISA